MPEAQLDRFMFDIRVGYPTLDEEKKILLATTKGDMPDLKKVLSGKAIVNLQKLVTSVPVSEYTVDYVTRLVRATRPADEKSPQFIKDLVDYGAGPRAGQNLILGGKAMAAMDGRFSVSLDDIRKVAVPVLRHRISTNFQAQAEGQTTDSLDQAADHRDSRARDAQVRTAGPTELRPLASSRPISRRGGLSRWRTYQPVLRLGPQRPRAAASRPSEFAEANYAEPWKYEREARETHRHVARMAQGTIDAPSQLRDYLGAYRLAASGRRRRSCLRGVGARRRRVRIASADIGVFLVGPRSTQRRPERVPELMFEIVSPGPGIARTRLRQEA